MVVDSDQLISAHRNEHVLPARIAQTYEAAASNMSGSGGRRGPVVYSSPTIHAIDAKGLDAVLRKHEHVLEARMTAVLRKHHLKG